MNAARQLQAAVQLTRAIEFTTCSVAGRVAGAEGLQSGKTMHDAGIQIVHFD